MPSHHGCHAKNEGDDDGMEGESGKRGLLCPRSLTTAAERGNRNSIFVLEISSNFRENITELGESRVKKKNRPSVGRHCKQVDTTP